MLIILNILYKISMAQQSNPHICKQWLFTIIHDLFLTLLETLYQYHYYFIVIHFCTLINIKKDVNIYRSRISVYVEILKKKKKKKISLKGLFYLLKKKIKNFKILF
jgi:hypothetical protein